MLGKIVVSSIQISNNLKPKKGWPGEQTSTREEDNYHYYFIHLSSLSVTTQPNMWGNRYLGEKWGRWVARSECIVINLLLQIYFKKTTTKSWTSTTLGKTNLPFIVSCSMTTAVLGNYTKGILNNKNTSSTGLFWQNRPEKYNSQKYLVNELVFFIKSLTVFLLSCERKW